MISLKEIGSIAVLIGAAGALIFMCLIGILSFKLRKKKWHMMGAIADNAPKKLRKRSKLMMENGASWIVGSGAGYFWFTYLMLRFCWRIPQSEIIRWRAEIKNIFDKDYPLYLTFIIFFNISILGLFVAFLYYFIEM